MKRIYIASGLKNYLDVLSEQRWFESRGIGVTFDWAKNYHDEIINGHSPLRWEEVAALEVQGVRDADVLLMMMPAKRGAHVEFGVAVGCGKPIVVFSPDSDSDIAFYRLPTVSLHRKMSDASQAVMDILNKKEEAR